MPSSRSLGGAVPVIVTPFDEAGRIMPDALQTLVEWHLQRGAEGLCVAAGNGECAAMTPGEVGLVVRTATDAAAGRVPIIAGAIGPATATIEGAAAYVRAGIDNGADAVLVTPDPTRPDATRADIVARYAAIAARVPAPIVAYNSPRHDGVNLDAGTLAELADRIDLAGLKEASRDFHHIGQVIAAHGRRFPIFVGPGWLIMPGAALGAAGFLSTGPDLLGADTARILPLARAAGSPERSALHHRVAGIYHLLLEAGIGPSPAPLKATLALLGLPAGLPRDPARRVPPDNMARLRDGLRDLGVLA